ncbi:MAG: hypothetical protein ACLGIN_16305 [Candidatus Sericytochromatia bacterium]
MTAIRPTTAAPALRVAAKAAPAAQAASKAAPAKMAADSLQVTKTQAAKPAAATVKTQVEGMPLWKKAAIGVGTVAVAGALGYAGAMVGGLGTAVIAEKLVSGASAIVGAGLWGGLIFGAGGLIGGGLLGNKWMNKLFN